MAEREKQPVIIPLLATLTSWAQVVKHLEHFPAPKLGFWDADLKETAWVFRGVTDADFELEPRIERSAKTG
jgi:hypothetical protein